MPRAHLWPFRPPAGVRQRPRTRAHGSRGEPGSRGYQTYTESIATTPCGCLDVGTRLETAPCGSFWRLRKPLLRACSPETLTWPTVSNQTLSWPTVPNHGHGGEQRSNDMPLTPFLATCGPDYAAQHADTHVRCQTPRLRAHASGRPLPLSAANAALVIHSPLDTLAWAFRPTVLPASFYSLCVGPSPHQVPPCFSARRHHAGLRGQQCTLRRYERRASEQ